MSNNKYKILVVEDDVNICSFVYTLLNTNGYQVLTAGTCDMGEALFCRINPDLVILDLGLPDRDGPCLYSNGSNGISHADYCTFGKNRRTGQDRSLGLWRQ